MPNLYEALHILRCRREPNGEFRSDGFQMVNRGIIEFVREARDLKIFEKEEYSQDNFANNREVLCIHLSSITQVHFSRFRSHHGRFSGGQIKVIGIFDRQIEEKITLRMETSEYERLSQQLRPKGH